MSIEKGGKLNQLMTSMVSGSCATSVYFANRGYSHRLLHDYAESQWIEFLERGVFIRKGDQVDWMGGLYAIQQQLQKAIHVGGKSALGLRGYAHFLPMHSETIYLFGPQNEKLPQWFLDHSWGVQVQLIQTNLFEGTEKLGFTKHDRERFSIQISTPERAMMELLHLVPQEQSVEEARLLMQKLGTLRPKLVQELLEACNSVKVKRLFMVFAEESQHSWLERLNLKKINFGKGKRAIGKDGLYNSKYEISIPKKETEV